MAILVYKASKKPRTRIYTQPSIDMKLAIKMNECKLTTKEKNRIYSRIEAKSSFRMHHSL